MVNQYQEALEVIVKELEQKQGELNDLDRAIGDGDHGTNIVRGFEEVRKQGDSYKDLDFASVIKKIGTTLLGKVGGASGVLYAVACFKVATFMQNKELNEENILESLKVAKEEIMLKGKSVVGNKTMLDSMDGFIKGFEENMQSEKNLKKNFEAGVEKAKEAMENTKNLVARSGRASYLGQRSLGHQDAGATSFYYIMFALYNFLASNMIIKGAIKNIKKE